MLDPVSWKSANGRCVRAYHSGINTARGKLRLIDQTRLPEELVYLETNRLEEIFDYIKRLVVRGAPAIGCAAALGLAAAANSTECGTPAEFIELTGKYAKRLAESRPTAVNLFWALKRCTDSLQRAARENQTLEQLQMTLLQQALNILSEDIELCRSIGRHGMSLIKNGMGILTHCNAGALATGDYGTALSPIYCAHEAGLAIKVFADETRPLLQGSRLTAWELDKAGVDVTVICDNMAAQVMKEGRIGLIIVGADRIAANGDAANKIGTYSLAVLARHHNIPFYVAAPYSTIDLALPDGAGIPIEQREPAEIYHGFGRRTAPESASFYNPAFDVTPHELISGIITENGILYPPFTAQISQLVMEKTP